VQPYDLEIIGQEVHPTTKPKRLSDDLANQERIRELYSAGDLTKADIAREVGYPRKTMCAWIKSNLEDEGEEPGGGDVLP